MFTKRLRNAQNVIIKCSNEPVSNTAERFRVRAFVSYSHADATIAQKLHRKIETYRLPRHLRPDLVVDENNSGLGRIFRDREDLPAAEDLSESVKRALAGSQVLVVICSPDARQSIWVAREIELFRALHPDRPVLAALVRGEALHKSGAELHITLPYPVDRFCELSVAPYGDHWVRRFETLVEAAARLEVLTEWPNEAERSLAVAVELADLVAMGQCLRNAGVLKSRPKALKITGRGDEPRRQHLVWADTGHDQFRIAIARQTDHQSTTVSPNPDSTQISAILWVEDADRDTLSVLGDGAGDFQPFGDGHYRISSNPAELIATSHALLQRGGNSRTDLVIDIMDPQLPTASLLEQAGDIARASSGGVVLTDFKSAMVMLLQSGGQALEEIGELQTASGPQSLWSIA